MKKTLIVFTAAAVCYTVCGFTFRPLKDAVWLAGTWKNKTSWGTIYEQWKPVNENEMAGKSFMLKGKDTSVFETIRLVRENDSLFYIPQVKKQNKGLPVRFACTKITGQQLVFENPQHDFPQKITYTLVTADSVVAEISGTRKGKERREVFPMGRID